MPEVHARLLTQYRPAGSNGTFQLDPTVRLSWIQRYNSVGFNGTIQLDPTVQFSWIQRQHHGFQYSRVIPTDVHYIMEYSVGPPVRCTVYMQECQGSDY